MAKKNNYLHIDQSKPPKAYKNLEFLNSPAAREVRILSEFMEPDHRFRKQRVHDTVVFFGSARTLEKKKAQERLKDLQKTLKSKKKLTRKQEQELQAARRAVINSRYYEDARKLANMITEWSVGLGRGKRRFIVCSGGGPGIMEAANRGATEHPHGSSIGLNISLPFEQNHNPYITPDLDFEFHYFFIRKYWFTYMAKALVVFPGGFGTMDEMFELLTLRQTGKIKKKIPIVVYGTAYWKKLLNFDVMLEYGTISEEDLDLFHFSDNTEEAFDYLKSELSRLYLKKSK